MFRERICKTCNGFKKVLRKCVTRSKRTRPKSTCRYWW